MKTNNNIITKPVLGNKSLIQSYDDILYYQELARQKKSKEVWYYDPCGKEKDGTLNKKVEKL
jgi:hypothetical protein